MLIYQNWQLSALARAAALLTVPAAHAVCRQKALSVQRLTHGYQDRMLFDDTSLEIEKGERVAIIGAPPSCLPHRR